MKSTAIGIQFDVNDLDANYEVLGTSDNYSFQYKLGKGSDLVGFEGETAQRVISLEGNYGTFDVRIFAVSDIGIRSDFIEGVLIVNPPEFNGTFTFATLEVTNAREDPALTSEIIEAPTGVGDDLVVFSQYPGKNINLAWSLSPPPGHALEGKVVTSELLNDTFFDHFSISIKTGENGVAVSDANLSSSTSLQGYLRTSDVTGELNNYRNFNFNLTPQIFNDDNLNFGREVSFEIVAHDINGNTSTGILSGINFAPEPESVAYSLNGINAAFSWDINTSDFVAININTLAIPSSQTLEYPEDLQKSREYLEDCEAAINWSNVPNVEYTSGEKVEYQGLLYKCIQDHTTTSSQKLPTNTSYWSEIGEYYQFQYNEYTSFEQSIEIPQVWGYSYYYTFQAVDDFGPGAVFNLTEGGVVDSTDTGEFRELYALSPEINISNLRYRERKDDLVFDWDILDQDGNVVDLEQYRVAFTSNDIPSVLGISGHLYNNDTDVFLTGITEGDKSRTKIIDEQGKESVAYGLPTTKVFDHFEFTRNLNNEIFKSRGYPEGWEYFRDTGVYSYGDFVIGGDGFLYNVVDGIPVVGDNDVPPDDQYHGYPGSFAVDDNYYYLCVAANTWRRIGAVTVTRTSSYLGDTDFDDDYFYICKQTTSWLKIPLADADLNKEAVVGEIDYDLNYLYVNTNDGWKRHALTTWNGTNVGGGQGDSAYVKPSYESWNPSETYYNNSSAPWADVFEYNDQLYVTNQTFGPTSTSVRGLFNYNTSYSLGDIVIAPTDSRIRQYDSNNNYAISDIVLYSNGIYQNLVYQSSADVVTPGTNRRRWKLLSPFFDIECAYYESPGSSINSIPAVENWTIKTPENLSFFELYASGYQYPDLRNWNNQDEFNTGSFVVYNNDIWSGVGASGPDTDAGAVVPSASATNYWANNIGGVDFFTENQPGDRIYHNEAVYQCLDFNPTGAPIIASTTSPQEINSDYINSQWMPFWELNDEYNDFVFGHIGINESGKRSVGLEVGIISSDGEVLDVQRIVGRNPEPSIMDAGFTVDSLSEAGKVKFDFNYAFGLREKTTKVHLYRSSERQFDITGSDGLALSNIEEGGSLVKVLLGAGDATFGDNITEIVDTPPIPVENGAEQITGYYYKILPFDDFGSGDLYSINNKVLVYPKNFNTQDPSVAPGPVLRTSADDIPGPVVNFEGRTAFENFFLSWQVPGSEDSDLLKNIPNDLSHYEVWSGKSDHLYFGSLNVALTQENNKKGFRRIAGNIESVGDDIFEQNDPAEGITNAVNIFNVSANGNSAQTSREGVSNEEAYFWIRAVDKAGNKSPFTGKADLGGDNVEGLRLQLGQMNVTDIDGFELALTDSFPNTIALEPNNPFKNNTPEANKVSWDAHTLFHNNSYYQISGSGVGSGYIWWNSGDSQYSFSEIHPAGSDGTDGDPDFDDGDFIIARSRRGIATPVFNVFANALIGTANIADAAIISAKINDLTADKITAGTIGAEDIQIGNEGNIRSQDFDGLSDDSKGFVVSGDGSFVFAADNGRLYFDNSELVLEGKLRQVDGSEYTFIDLVAEPSYFYYSEDVEGNLSPDSNQAIEIIAKYQNSDISAEDVRFRMTTANGESVFTYDEFADSFVQNGDHYAQISGFTYYGYEFSPELKTIRASFDCDISSPGDINEGFDNIYDAYSGSAVILYASGVGTSIETSTTISLISDGAPAKTVKLEASDYSIVYDDKGENPQFESGPIPNNIRLTATASNSYSDPKFQFKLLNDGSTLQDFGNGSKIYDYNVTGERLTIGDTLVFQVEVREGDSSENEISTDSISIISVKQGENALAGVLTNENHTIPANADGTYTSTELDEAGGIFQVFYGGVDVTDEVSFGISGLSNKNNLKISFSTSEKGKYSLSESDESWNNDVETFDLTASYQVTDTVAVITKTYTISKAKRGDNGSSVNIKFKRSDSTSAPGYNGGSGWDNNPPSGDGFLWAVKITTDKNGNETIGTIFRVDADAVAEVYIYKQGSLGPTEIPSTDTVYDFSDQSSTSGPLKISNTDKGLGWTSSPAGLDSADEISVLVGVASGYKDQANASIRWLTPGVVFSKKGDDGEEGRSPTFRGKWDDSDYNETGGTTYYAIAPNKQENKPGRGDIVEAANGSFYICIKSHGPLINNDTSKQNPETSNTYWKPFGAEFSSVATELLLTKEAFITERLTLGIDPDTTDEDPHNGIIMTAGFEGGVYNVQEKKDVDSIKTFIKRPNCAYYDTNFETNGKIYKRDDAGALVELSLAERMLWDNNNLELSENDFDNLDSLHRYVERIEGNLTRYLYLGKDQFQMQLENKYEKAGFLLGRLNDFSLNGDPQLRAVFDIGGVIAGTDSFFRFDTKKGKIEMGGAYINNSIYVPYNEDGVPDIKIDTTQFSDDPLGAFIGGGYNNYIGVSEGTYNSLGSAIVGGANNKLEGRFSFIGNGFNNDCRDNFSAILAGYNNQMPKADEANQGANLIGAGQDNVIEGGTSQAILNASYSKIENYNSEVDQPVLNLLPYEIDDFDVLVYNLFRAQPVINLMNWFQSSIMGYFYLSSSASDISFYQGWNEPENSTNRGLFPPDQASFEGAWDSELSYSSGDSVLHNSAFYKSKVNSNQGIEPGRAENWENSWETFYPVDNYIFSNITIAGYAMDLFGGNHTSWISMSSRVYYSNIQYLNFWIYPQTGQTIGGKWCWVAENTHPWIYVSVFNEWFYVYQEGDPRYGKIFRVATGQDVNF